MKSDKKKSNHTRDFVYQKMVTRGLNTSQLAEKLGVSYKYMLQYINGQRGTFINASFVLKLTEVLGIDLKEYLLYEDDFIKKEKALREIKKR